MAGAFSANEILAMLRELETPELLVVRGAGVCAGEGTRQPIDPHLPAKLWCLDGFPRALKRFTKLSIGAMNPGIAATCAGSTL